LRILREQVRLIPNRVFKTCAVLKMLRILGCKLSEAQLHTRLVVLLCQNRRFGAYQVVPRRRSELLRAKLTWPTEAAASSMPRRQVSVTNADDVATRPEGTEYATAACGEKMKWHI